MLCHSEYGNRCSFDKITHICKYFQPHSFPQKQHHQANNFFLWQDKYRNGHHVKSRTKTGKLFILKFFQSLTKLRANLFISATNLSIGILSNSQDYIFSTHCNHSTHRLASTFLIIPYSWLFKR